MKEGGLGNEDASDGAWQARHKSDKDQLSCSKQEVRTLSMYAPPKRHSGLIQGLFRDVCPMPNASASV